MYANWARAKNDVGSLFWTWNFSAKICKNGKLAWMAIMAKIAKVAQSKIVRLLKTFKIWFFLKKVDGYFEKKNLNLIHNR